MFPFYSLCFLYELFRKQPYLYQIAIRIGHIAGALAPRFRGGRKDRLCAIVERMLVFLIYIGEGGHIKCQFHCAVHSVWIIELTRDHLLESISGEEDDAHITQRHLHVGLDAIPIGGEAEGTRVEIDSRFVVVGEESNGVEFESFLHLFIVLLFFYSW